ncbi:glucose PTS transporter subunit IIA [Spiroplasma tabanidicola]|uniref:PTS system, beta-glucoside-specific IIABC component n=1 Tax=Spiroplasma tabanidicola TaxID=324079 RepID=A0A6I6C3T4_9MOLU|nr:glucose PTS transporter subunit IIA [Spiroplasma tabanidicola]QGS51467.1 hypothetical protein STABA_v1c01000 [Spiroplasma tabanidicola]
MRKSLKIYSPVNGEIKKIEDSIDEVFKSKALGDGFVIIPLENEFVSPFEEAIVKMVFPTKHAYGFLVDDLNFLIHCGMDTVKLEGSSFISYINVDQNLKKGNKIFKADLEIIKENNLSIETPIVFEVQEIENYNFKTLNLGKVKKGDLVCEIEYSLKEIQENQENQELTLKSFKSKYELAAEQFVEAVGGKNNFSEVYNCMTRLRFAIVEKEKVDTDSIKKNKLVKGIVWNGLELQVIIGGECYKLKDEILNMDKKTEDFGKRVGIKPPLQKRILGAVAGIMTPSIPVIMASGILSVIYALTNQSHITKDLSNGVEGADALSLILFIMSKVGLTLVGVFFCINTVKFFGGNPLAGALIALALISRFYFSTGESDSNAYQAGHYISNAKFGVQGWYLFSIADYPIVIKSYEGSVLPFIVAGIIVAYLDKWVKTWMPSSLDVVFRYGIVLIVTTLSILLFLGPLLSLIEYGMAQFIFLIEDLPIGLGVAIFAFLWQPLVLTGVHVAVIMTIMIPFYTGIPSLMLTGSALGVWGQVGAGLGVGLVTKNKNLKSAVYGALPGGLFGITEPIIYGVTLPKGKPFLMGCIAAGITGILAGVLDVKTEVPAGQGIFAILGYVGFKHQALAVLVRVVSIGLGTLLSAVTYRERLKEDRYSRNVTRKLKKLIEKVNKELLVKYNENLNNIDQEVKNSKKILAQYNKYVISMSIIESKIISTEQKEEKNKKRLYKKAVSLIKSKNTSPEFLETRKDFIKKYNEYNLDNIKNELDDKKNDLNNSNKEMLEKYKNVVEKIVNSSSSLVSDISQDLKIMDATTYANGYWNAIHSVEIGFGYEDLKKYGLSKETKRKIKGEIKNVQI